MRPELARRAAIAILWIWTALLFVTHYGHRSPYSYGWAMFGQPAGRINGAVVNPDSSYAHTTAYFLYDGIVRNGERTQNIRLPIHSFSVAVTGSFTRSFLGSSYAINLLFLFALIVAAVNLAMRAGLAPAPATVSFLAILSLPIFVTYIGQPLHYIVGTVTNFLVVLAVFALRDEDSRNPWINGLAVAVLTLSYDPYVFIGAIVIYVCWVIRFARPSHYAIFAAVGILPRVIWQWFVDGFLGTAIGSAIRETFLLPFVRGWLGIVRDPVENALMPFVVSQIGMRVAAQQTLALVYWPLLVLVACGLVRYRTTGARWQLIALLPLIYLLEQLLAAAFDWENNPRRAIPLVIAAGFGLCAIARQTWESQKWRMAIVGVWLICAVLSFADTIFRNPVITYFATAQAMSRAPKEALAFHNQRLDPSSLPAMMRDEGIAWRDLPTAPRLTTGRAMSFVFSQAFVAAAVAALFWLTGRSGLLPRHLWWIATAIWLVSLGVRFI